MASCTSAESTTRVRGEREIMEENENKALALLEGASILKNKAFSII